MILVKKFTKFWLLGFLMATLLEKAATTYKRLIVTRSESFNYHNSYTPDKAHDRDHNTWYSVKDGEVAGNFLKLYLSETYSIGLVIMVSRGMSSAKMVERMVNTEVRVYSTEGEETELASCGTITGLNPGDINTIEGRTYSLNCDGAIGDMLYLTDLDYTENVGHNIAEVEIYGTGFVLD
ncbi:hypothetical protein ACHWQZ_G002552 [Mnemiopsis leidyi]